jgi:phosphoribulokinase
MLGVAGDSGAGKTTLVRGLLRILGEGQVTHVSADHYHRYDRRQRAERGITPLDPEANYLDILDQHLRHLRAGRSVLKPIYDHRAGTFAPPELVSPSPFILVEGLLAFQPPALRELYDVRVYLDPPEALRRHWKLQRDCTRRGYTTDAVLAELDRREADAEAFVRPQRHRADIVVSFKPNEDSPDDLDASVMLRSGMTHCDLMPIVGETPGGIALEEQRGHRTLLIPGTISAESSAAAQNAIWECMQFASHLRTERLGEYTVGADLHRSESLAIVQLIVLFHLVIARAALSVGADGARTDREPALSPASPQGTPAQT